MARRSTCRIAEHENDTQWGWSIMFVNPFITRKQQTGTRINAIDGRSDVIWWRAAYGNENQGSALNDQPVASSRVDDLIVLMQL